MDDVVKRAMAKWPDVPAVYGWLALDRRGHWLIKRGSITNAALNQFIGRNYLCDPEGCWFFQNGPQKVFVDLDYTPLVFRVDSALGEPLQLVSHLGTTVEQIHKVWIDEQGCIIVQAPEGTGLIHDQDLDPLFLHALEHDNGSPLDDHLFDDLSYWFESRQPPPIRLRFKGQRLALHLIESHRLGSLLGFIPHPLQPKPAAI